MVCPMFASVFVVLIGITVGSTSTASANAEGSSNQLLINQKVWLGARKASHGESYVDMSREFDRHSKVTYNPQKGIISGALT